MLAQDVKVGMKVVPHSQDTIYSRDLYKSMSWARAKAINQDYLFVRELPHLGQYCFVLSWKRHKDGDYFIASDFEPY
jgi:hypothetical protein